MSPLTRIASIGAAPPLNRAMQLLEWHFHVYFNENDPKEVDKAVKIRKALVDNLNAVDRAFVAVPLHHFVPGTDQVQAPSSVTHGLNMKQVGPHPMGSFETWVPIESFAYAYEWFTTHRDGLNVLVHPLTMEEIRDHTERAAWMGTPLPLKLSALEHLLPEAALQYPHFQLGYSKPQQG